MLDSKYQACYDAACRYLRYRPRTEFEVKTCLCKKGFDDSSIESVLRGLRDRGLIDDADFARFWRDNRESFSPRSRAMLRMELRQKGVDHEIIDEVAEGIDEESSACKAARKKMRLFAGSDYEEFYRGLGAFLRRRGFNGYIVRRAVARLWQEKESENDQSFSSRKGQESISR